jgi:sRNA-binding regulator protein Hfq
MAAVHPHALQDTFLEHVRKHDVPVTVFLANGIRTVSCPLSSRTTAPITEA